jgi:hypothetical protein
MLRHDPCESVPLEPVFFSTQKDFIERYGQHPGVLRVHYDDPNEGTPRHHAFYIDALTLLEIKEVQEELSTALSKLSPQPDLIISTTHAAGIKLGELASAALNCPYTAISPPFSSATAEQSAVTSAAKTILFIDDVFITGSRLDSYNRSIREEKSLFKNIKNIHYFTLLATPSSDETYEQRVRGLTRNHDWECKLSHLYKINLPDWHSKEDCPWCKEKEILDKTVKDSELLDPPLGDRLNTLNNTKVGLSENAIHAHPAVSNLPKLGSGSVLMRENSSALQLVFSCASALQRKRTCPNLPLQPNAFPSPRYLAKRIFEDNYTERLIWLALLRAVKSCELEPSLKKYLSERALACLTDAEPDFLIYELSTNWLLGKFGALDKKTETEELFERSGHSWLSIEQAGYSNL